MCCRIVLVSNASAPTVAAEAEIGAAPDAAGELAALGRL
jgi:hypothetical protein